MGLTVKVICDACWRNLTTTNNCVDYRLALIVQGLPHESGLVTNMAISPPLDEDYYFCDMPCLGQWMELRNSP